ncbi:MAG: hypothetical protein JHC84_05855 [Solirubrobacteraceae bacterium]|nr:hypothetical protein [Solirubrobacteraceae bacterium]
MLARKPSVARHGGATGSGAARAHDAPAFARALVGLLRSRTVAVGTFGTVVLFAVFGSELLGTPVRGLNLDRERGGAALFSASLLATGSLSAMLLAEALRRWHRAARIAAVLMAAVLALMAVDEWSALHERLQWLGDLPWTYWYAPIPVTAMAAGVVMSRVLDTRARVYLALGFAAWVIAAVIETFLWGPGPLFQHPVTMAVEEVLEMLAAISLAAGLLRGAAQWLTQGAFVPSRP